MTITIVGNIGSGKSTLMPLLAKHLKAKTVDADNLFQTSDPFAQRYLENHQRWAFANELWLTYERAKIIQASCPVDNTGYTVVDSGLLTSWIYTYSHFITGTIDSDEWELYQKIYDELASKCITQMKVVYLKCDTSELLKRIARRGRDYELAFYNTEYLQQLNHGLEALSRKLHNEGVEVLEVDEALFPNFHKKSEDQESLLKKIAMFCKT